MTAPLTLLIGTYTEGPSGLGAGLYRCPVVAATGALGAPRRIAALRNPTYLATHPALDGTLYAIEETAAPALVRLHLTSSGARVLQRRRLTGSGACHLAVSPDGRYLATAQYQSGHVDLFSLGGDGAIGAHLAAFHAEGNGPNPARQRGPHAHCVLFLTDPDVLAVADLGRDCVTLFDLAAGAPELRANTARQIAFPPGSGPRHITRIAGSDDLAVLCELDENLTLLRRDQAGWHLASRRRVFPATPQDGAAAALRTGPTGLLYASGRSGHEIACIACPAGQAPKVVQTVPSGGHHPRDILLSPDGRLLMAANQHSHSITAFAVAPDGLLRQTPHRAEIGSPACLIWSTAPSGDLP